MSFGSIDSTHRVRTREGIARARAEGKPIGKRGPDKKPRRRRNK